MWKEDENESSSESDKLSLFLLSSTSSGNSKGLSFGDIVVDFGDFGVV